MSLRELIEMYVKAQGFAEYYFNLDTDQGVVRPSGMLAMSRKDALSAVEETRKRLERQGCVFDTQGYIVDGPSAVKDFEQLMRKE